MTRDTEAEAWTGYVEVLRRGLADRKPGSIARIKSAIARLDTDISALALRRELAALAKADARVAKITAEIEAADRRVRDLRRLIRKLKAVPLDQDVGGTPELLSKPSMKDLIKSLEDVGAITVAQGEAARTIAKIVEATAVASHAKVSRYNSAGRGGGQVEIAVAIDQERTRRFLPWSKALRARRDRSLYVCLGVAAEGFSLFAIARRERMGWDRALRLLRLALDAYRAGSATPANLNTERTINGKAARR